MTRHIAFEKLHNFRDLGGYRTADGGTVRWGRLYRSDSLGKLAGADMDTFTALGVRTVIDLRYPFEIEARGRVPQTPGLAYHNLSVEHRPYSQPRLGPEVRVAPFLAEKYAEVALDGAAELRTVLELIAADANAPVVFHCAAGKDRTGIVAALVLGLLGVSEADIAADFALTNLATDRSVADYVASGRPLTWPGYGQAPAELMVLFLADLTRTYGSLPDYVRDHLGLDDGVVAELRAHLLTNASDHTA
ncbi:tyrosine-protein phosphatase [Longispora sp. NPDC051575]|uniref:tyrosine-protein phosphatase n=1 Tax=Longispora sp. NPDC051575 TaxID=3154943 RepID=UPI00341CE0E4